MSRPDRAAVVAWVEATCAAQGVPVKVTDPLVLRRVGALLGVAAGKPRAHGAPAPSTRVPTAPLQAPLRLHAVQV